MSEHLDKLIARLEKATEGTRELDCWIIWTLWPNAKFMRDAGDVRTRRDASYGTVSEFPISEWKEATNSGWDTIALTLSHHIPELEHSSTRFTSSIDAALTLIPDGMVWDVDGGEVPSTAIIWSKESEGEYRGRAPAPALALCIAALKARAKP